MDILRGLLGIVSLVGIAFLLSENRKAINWRTVITGLGLQIVIGLMVFYVDFVRSIFDYIGHLVTKIIDFTSAGTTFLLKGFGDEVMNSAMVNFAFTVIPIIIFFSALTSMLYYLGILQKIVYGFAWVMKRLMRISGAESLSAAGNIFLGQTEAPLLVRPYLGIMTRSEMMALMTGGMATIAGSVLISFIGFLGNGDIEIAGQSGAVFFTRHLLIASIMSAPAALVVAKILVPEREKFNDDFSLPKDKLGTNILEAISNGTTDGLRLAINVGAMLLVFIALMAMANGILGSFGNIPLSMDYYASMHGGFVYESINSSIAAGGVFDGLSFEFLTGYFFAPIAWLVGVPADDMLLVGQLLGEKTIINEFVGYLSLDGMVESGAFKNEKSITIATYVLCGFSNFASIGIQIGGIGALAPTRKGLLSQLGFKALIGGTLACLFTAAVAGMLA